jgi:3-phenylpropionate/trans-cinnamate dioxygenase ferredoxin subunit
MSKQLSATLALGDVAEGKMRSCTIGGREIVVCRTKQGVYALDNICTHAYARLDEGRLRGTRLICPLHGAAFDVRDGRVLGAPATRPLATHAVNVIDDRIEISLSSADSRQLTL